MKRSHDRIFIDGIWTNQGWAQRFMSINMILFIATMSVMGWIYILK